MILFTIKFKNEGRKTALRLVQLLLLSLSGHPPFASLASNITLYKNIKELRQLTGCLKSVQIAIDLTVPGFSHRYFTTDDMYETTKVR